ncbi:MAG: hypothetical protein R3E77_09090 [Steroidobacteraceae bacterium]
MREAIREIREALGPDAIIVSTQSSADGVVVMAARDASEVDVVRSTPSSPPILHPQTSAAAEPIGTELRELRRLLEVELATLAWNDYTRREPVRAAVRMDLCALGLDEGLAQHIADEGPATQSLDSALCNAHASLLAQLRECDLGPLAQRAVAFVGPAGSGKSSLLTKLAIGHVSEHGGPSLLIVADASKRVASDYSPQRLAALLGAEYAEIAGVDDLRPILERANGRQRVMIDDCDHYLVQQAQGHARVARILALQAHIEARAMAATIDAYCAHTLAGVAITNVDRAASLGQVIAALVARKVPMAFLSDGPDVVRDLHVATSGDLLARALAVHEKFKTRNSERNSPAYKGVTHGFG